MTEPITYIPMWVSIVGLISSIVSLLAVLALAFIWKGKVDSDREEWRRDCEQYPPAEMFTMVKTLWDIYVVGALHQRPDLAERNSPLKLTDKAKDLIPGPLKHELDRVAGTEVCTEDLVSGYTVVKLLGVDKIEDMAKTTQISIQESVAVLSTYLKERTNGAKPE